MTNKEAIVHIEHIRPKKCKMVNGKLQGGFPDHDSDTGKAIDKAIEALEKADKYRWHDLRENICDLPRVINGYGESDYLLVKTERCDTEIACYSYIKKQWSIDSYVLAWRYIEPFKEEADEE